MSSRERSGATGVARPPSADSPPAQVPRNGDAMAALDRESLLPALAPAQQHALLDLAARQGFLHARQLPPPGGSPASERGRILLNTLLRGQPPEQLPAFHPEPITPLDAELDPFQLDAVARALHTP